MRPSILRVALSSVVLVLLAGALPAHAQASRTWVSGVGDDVNPCSRTAPCKTFAGAISKTAPQGEISVLDPGGFGAVTITKSMSIVSEGSEGSILAAGTNGIIINAGVNDVVNLHGLFIEGFNTGLNGIRILQAKAVHIRKCLIRGFPSATSWGITVEPTASPVAVFISDCTIAKSGNGVQLKYAGTGTTRGLLERVQIDGTSGIGISSDGAKAAVRVKGSTIIHNTTGVSATNGGQLASFGDNVLLANGTDGTFSTSFALK